MRIFSVILIAILLSSCVTRYSYEQLNWAASAWIGKTKDELVSGNGLPFREYKLSDGSSIVQYKLPGDSQLTDGTGPTDPTAKVNTWKTVYSEFTVNSSNIIVKWKGRN